MIRYTVITVLLLLAAFVVQQFLPAFTGLHHSRILLVQLVFLCSAVTVGMPTMLLLAFIGGFLWDTHCALGPSAGDPAVYVQPVDALRFGYSILLFAAIGILMQGVQPLFHEGKWQVSAMLSGIAIFLYLSAEYALISFVRGSLVFAPETLRMMAWTSLLTMLFSPLVFWVLFRVSALCQHELQQNLPKRRRRRRTR